MRPVVAIALLLPLLAGNGLRAARVHLEAGNGRLAIKAYRDILAEHPGLPEARIGLARAMTLMGNYDAALAHLTETRGDPAWDEKASNAEGQCWLRVGDPSAAVASFEDAVTLSPGMVRGWYGLALAADEAGDRVVTERALDELWEAPRGGNLYALAKAWIALESGSPSFELRLDEARDQLGTETALQPKLQLALLEATRWLDVGEPDLALRALDPYEMVAPKQVRLHTTIAEAWRRLGEPEIALEAVDSYGVKAHRAPFRSAIRARILVDLGRADEARQVRYPDPNDAEVLATRWYVARALGDDTTDLEAKWKARNRAADRSLERLIPIERR